MRNVMVSVIGGVILLAAIGWQSFELRRLSTAQAELSARLTTLAERLEPLALQAESRAPASPPAPPGPSPTEMEAPRGAMPRSIAITTPPAPDAPPPGVDVTGGRAADPPPDPCEAACRRAVDCALTGCRVGTTGTDPLFAECGAACAEGPALAGSIGAATTCGDILAATRRLPAFAAVCR